MNRRAFIQIAGLTPMAALYVGCGGGTETPTAASARRTEFPPPSEGTPARLVPGLTTEAAEAWNAFPVSRQYYVVGGDISMGQPDTPWRFTISNPTGIEVVVDMPRFESLANHVGCPNMLISPDSSVTNQPPYNIYNDDALYLNLNLFTVCLADNLLGKDWSDPDKIAQIQPRAQAEAIVRVTSLARLPYEQYLILFRNILPQATPVDETTYYSSPYNLQQGEGLEGWPFFPIPDLPPMWEQVIPAPSGPQG